MVDYTLEPAEDQPPSQSFMLEPAEEPSTRGRLQPLISQIQPAGPDIQEQPKTFEEVSQRAAQIRQKGYEDFNFWNNTVNNFTAGIKGVEDAINASEDKNRPWYERGMAAAGQVPFAAGTAAMAPVSAAFQVVGGALEKLTGGYTGSSEEWQAALMIPAMFGGAKYAELKEPPPSFKPAPIRPIEGSPNPSLLRSAGARTGVPEVDAVLNHPIIHSVLDNAVIDDTHEIPNSWGGSVPLDNPITYRDKDFPKTLTVDGVTFDTADPAIIHENVEEFVIDKLMEGGMSRDAALRAAYWGWGNPAEHAWYRAHGMDPDHVEAALRPYLDKIASRKANEANIPADLFRETYPDGNPLKDTSGEIEKPTAEEAARAQEIIRNNTGPRITGGTVDRPDVRVAQDLGIIGPERPSINEGTPEEAARNAVPAITAYHGSPYSFDAFDMGKIGTGEGAQSYGHGLYFAENQDVAKQYQETTARPIFRDEAGNELSETQVKAEIRKAVDKAVPNSKVSPDAIASDVTRSLYIESEFNRYENVVKESQAAGEENYKESTAQYAAAVQAARKFNIDRSVANFYQVRIHADPEHFLDWDKPLSEQSEHVRAAVGKIPGALKKLGYDNDVDPPGSRIYGNLMHGEYPGSIDPSKVSEVLREAGIPGIKYLDQGSRNITGIETEIKNAKKAIDDLEKNPMADADRQASELYRYRLNLERAQQELVQAGEGTRNFVVFDHDDVEITHRNGEPIKPQTPPAPSSKPEQPPADSWRARFEHFVDRIQTADDLKQLIRMAADENQNFLAARRGDIPLAQVEKIAEASGMDTPEVLKSGVGRQLRNDDQVDLAMRIMLRTTDSAKDMAKQLMTDQSDQNFIKFQEALMRRDLAVEQIVGLRAEWGRTGNVFQKFMKEVKDGQALDKFISETCPL